jgi:hypothetical protein
MCCLQQKPLQGFGFSGQRVCGGCGVLLESVCVCRVRGLRVTGDDSICGGSCCPGFVLWPSSAQYILGLEWWGFCGSAAQAAAAAVVVVVVMALYEPAAQQSLVYASLNPKPYYAPSTRCNML